MEQDAAQPQKALPYGRQSVSDDDIAAVVDVLRGTWLTTGPKVQEFESAAAAKAGAKHGVAVSSGTAALHAMMAALDVGPGDEVIVPTITFAASANCAVYQGATPVFVDVEPDTLLIDADAVEAAVTKRTRAIVAVDFAGQPCDYGRLEEIAHRHGLALVADACHSLGGAYKGRPVGSLALASAFSFHPVKPMTTGEGGMVVTDSEDLAQRMRNFRNHGITTDHHQRESMGTWYYEMRELGFNYRLSDIQCALGLSQIGKLDQWTRRRQDIAARYDRAFESSDAVEPLSKRNECSHAYHLYVIRWRQSLADIDRAVFFERLRASGIGVNVHYIPVHLHPFYREQFGTHPGQCPVAEHAYEEIISLPIFPAMADEDVDRVVALIQTCVESSTSAAA